jgi:hypothetical protein
VGKNPANTLRLGRIANIIDSRCSGARLMEFKMIFAALNIPPRAGKIFAPLFCGAAMLASGASAQTIPAAIEAPGLTEVLKAHAEGAQVYECKADAAGKLAWTFREPIATLLVDGRTVGRHYAGPNWEHSDGSAVSGKAVGNAPGATPQDIPWLKLEVASRRGSGLFSEVTTVQRINTKGGKLDGACEHAGAFQSAPYSADYVFLRKS